jgi:hypothetical protein
MSKAHCFPRQKVRLPGVYHAMEKKRANLLSGGKLTGYSVL